MSPHILPDFERDVVEGPLDSVDRSIDKASAKVLRLERTLKHRNVLNPENVRNLSGELARFTSKLARLRRRRDSLVTSIAVNQDPFRKGPVRSETVSSVASTERTETPVPSPVKTDSPARGLAVRIPAQVDAPTPTSCVGSGVFEAAKPSEDVVHTVSVRTSLLALREQRVQMASSATHRASGAVSDPSDVEDVDEPQGDFYFIKNEQTLHYEINYTSRSTFEDLSWVTQELTSLSRASTQRSRSRRQQHFFTRAFNQRTGN